MTDENLTVDDIKSYLKFSKGRVLLDASQIFPASKQTFILPPEVQDDELLSQLIPILEENNYLEPHHLSRILDGPVFGYSFHPREAEYLTCLTFGNPDVLYYGDVEEPRMVVKAFFSTERSPKPADLETELDLQMISPDMAALQVPGTGLELILHLFSEGEIESGSVDSLTYLEENGLTLQSLKDMTVAGDPKKTPLVTLFNRQAGSIGFLSVGEFFHVSVAEYMAFADIVDTLYESDTKEDEEPPSLDPDSVG